MKSTRLQSLEKLNKIFSKKMKSKDALSDTLNDVHDSDRSFIMEIVYGCVRYRLFLEWVLSRFLKKLHRTKKKTFLNLMMALYQLHFMRVPDFAAVHESVEIEKSINGNPSLVNGVLRNYLRRRHAIHPPSFDVTPIEHIHITESYPIWLIRKWAERFSLSETLEMARSYNRIPPLTLRVNTLKGHVLSVLEDLKRKGITCDRSMYSPDGIKTVHTPFSAVSDLMGMVFVQDEASQLISYLLNPQPGDRILDACAAPGGKSTHIAQITHNGASIDALDVDMKRLSLLRENIELLQATSISVISGDALTFRTDVPYDRILIDAPCSALGVIRRNPDVKYRHQHSNLKSLGEKQVHILLSVSNALAQGGEMVYCVCSTEPEETVDVIKEFLNIKSDFYIINDIDDLSLEPPFKEILRGLISKEGYFITYPHIHDMDGFFAVRLKKK